MPPRILVCDDEQHIVLALRMKLERAGFDVETALDPLTALAAIERTVPALLVTDCQMPQMTGIELCRKLRSTPSARHLPVIMLTAKAYEFDQEELKRELGLAAIIHKPFSPRDMLQLVQETLASCAAPAGAAKS